MQNAGQVIDTSGTPISDIFSHSLFTQPTSFYFNNKITFAFWQFDTTQVDSMRYDTIARIDMSWIGENMNISEPTGFDTDNIYNGGTSDAFVAGYSHFMSKRWSSFLGGNDREVLYSSKFLNPYGYSVGYTSSSNFPLLNNLQNQPTYGSYNGVIMRYDVANALNIKENELINLSVFFNLYPNPANNKLMLDFAVTSNSVDVVIYNALGVEIRNLIIKGVNTNPKMTLDISDMVSGIYIVKAIDEKGHSVSRKFVKN